LQVSRVRQLFQRLAAAHRPQVVDRLAHLPDGVRQGRAGGRRPGPRAAARERRAEEDARMRGFTSCFFLFLFFSTQVIPKEQKEWLTLTGCTYVAHKNNDGDSFHVRCGADEFVLRLYFVDTPETNMTYGNRTQEQAAHFGATLD